jgi:hypothetical protein
MLKKRWQDMTPFQQAGILILTIIQFSLLGAAQWDLRHHSAAELNGSKPFWLVAVFVNFIGPIAYFLFGRKQGEATI